MMKFSRVHSPCVEHTQARGKQEYATVWYRGRQDRLHRKVYMEQYGVPIVGIIRHTCDNKRCINPLHLMDGTRSQNAYDAQREGAKLSHPKLSPEQIGYLLNNLHKPDRVLGPELGVSYVTIWRFRNGKHQYIQAYAGVSSSGAPQDVRGSR